MQHNHCNIATKFIFILDLVLLRINYVFFVSSPSQGLYTTQNLLHQYFYDGYLVTTSRIC